VHDWQGVSDKDFDGADDEESTTILQASGEDCCDSVEVQLFQRLTNGVEAGLCHLATDSLNLAESVSLYTLFWVN